MRELLDALNFLEEEIQKIIDNLGDNALQNLNGAFSESFCH
jgi:hypothetical protein